MNKINFLKNKKDKAFSIIEIIIYLAIFSFVSIFVVNSLIVSMSSFATTQTNHVLLESGLSSMDRMSRLIRQANSIDIGNSTLGLPSGFLQLNSTDSSGSPIVVKVGKVDNMINLYQPSDTLVGNLLNGNVAVDSLIFRRIDTTAGEAVKIEMILRDTKSKTNKTESFYNTIILRGAY